MRTTQSLSITLPTEMAKMVRNKVASGEYASESEVIRDGLRSLMARDRALEAWLRNEVVASHEKTRADPVRRRSMAQVQATLDRVHEEEISKKGGVSHPGHGRKRVER